MEDKIVIVGNEEDIIEKVELGGVSEIYGNGSDCFVGVCVQLKESVILLEEKVLPV